MQLDAEASQVCADRVQVQQVLINLLRNALQATKGVTSPEIVVAARAGEKGMVLVSVSDNGPGFSQPRTERFSPFPSDSGAGMGLGLSISRTIVESNGGRIWTEDREEGGARVCFSLPDRPRRAIARRGMTGAGDRQRSSLRERNERNCVEARAGIEPACKDLQSSA